ncbi:voltage-gated potassium channel [Serendipita vermifera]|nr:voltage-gated potassium channel [Serendipita vermifera]
MDNTTLYANQPGPSNPQWRNDEEAESQEVIIMDDLDHQYPPGANQRAIRSAKTPARTPKSARLRRRLDPNARRRARDDYGFTGRDTTSFRHALYLLLEQPTSSNSAFTLHLITNTIIVLSAFLTILETIPAFHAVDSSLWFGLETGIVVLFSVEYGARSIGWGFGESNGGWKRWWKWARSFFALVDLIAIVPYYVELALQADTTAFFRFSILRVFRLLRVFRPFRYSSTILLTIEVMIIAIRRSKDALLALSFFITMALVVFSTLLYFTERGVWDDSLETFVDADGVKSHFESIPAAAWFVLVTITTVGYGEIIPRTFFGRLVTVPLLLFGLLLVALPSFVLGREFAVVWEEMSAGVLDGIGLARDPESLTTPYTGQEAEIYGALPDDEDDDKVPLTGGKGKSRAKNILFDSEEPEADHTATTHEYVYDEEKGEPPVATPAAASTTSSHKSRKEKERQERRKRVDSNAGAATDAFMGITGHKRNRSQVDLNAALGGDSQPLASLLKELKSERDALRAEREALRLEREELAKERAALRKWNEERRGGS